MPEGVTVLYQEAITKIPLWFFIGLFICIAIAIIGCNLTFTRFDFIGKILTIISTITMIVFSCILPLFSNKLEVPTGQCEYQILINNDKALKEIYNKYEIIDVKGEIYIIRDKEHE